ncbi:tail assembly protein [Salinisphaera sp. T31B1]|uniref:tail assembly protein n=1 Tax=Salinisphaera sp. T31B1 TaxID=727963 RepID=UPI003341F6D8
MLRTIYLHGALAQFGESFALDVRDPAEACRALAAQIPGFRKAVEDGRWHVFRGPLLARNDLDEDGVHVGLGRAKEVHIMPVAEGAGDVFNIVAGVALIAAAPFTGGASLYAGGALVLTGITGMLTTQPKVDSYSDRERPDQRPSFIFDGPTNTSTQGLPVPLVYGRMRVGSIVVSASLSAEDIPLDGDGDDGTPVANP